MDYETLVKLQEALERFRHGQATQTDKKLLRHALNNGQIRLVQDAQQAVYFGGDVTDTVVVVGDNNVVTLFDEEKATLLQQLLVETNQGLSRILGTGVITAAGVIIFGTLITIILGIVVFSGWYIWSKYFSPIETVVATETQLFSFPDRQSNIIARLKPGQEVYLQGQIKGTGWVLLETQEGTKGWVRRANLKNVPEDIPIAANPLPPTFTPTSTPTETPTATPIPPTPTSTLTPTSTPTPLPKLEKTFYMIILDASERMKNSFGGSDSKWSSARESILDWLEGDFCLLPRRANYGLVVMGGNQAGSTQECGDTTQPLIPLGPEQRDVAVEQIKHLEPGGIAKFREALVLARNQFSELPKGMNTSILVVTGGGDQCSDDEWADVLEFLELSSDFLNTDSIRTELIILPNEGVDEAVSQVVSKIIELESDIVEVQAPPNPEILDNTIAQVAVEEIEYARAKEPEAIAADEMAKADAATAVAIKDNATPTPIPTPLPTQPAKPSTSLPATLSPTQTATAIAVAPTTPTSSSTPTLPPPSPTPTKMLSPTPTKTPVPANTPLPTPTATLSPTPTLTFTPTPIDTPSPPPAQSIPLQVQEDVYAQNCPLINQTSGHNELIAGQATISVDTVSGGHTGQGLRFNFSTEPLPNYTGWEIVLDGSSGVDLTSYSSLVFYIRGEAGGEEPNVWLMTDYGGGNFERYYQDIAVTTSWQQINIPLSNFTEGEKLHEDVDLGHINKIQFIFEWYDVATSGTIYIDDLCVQ